MSGEANRNAEIFSSLEIDTIGEIMNISMGADATSASTLLDQKVSITTPVVQVVSLEEFAFANLEPAVAVQIHYAQGISGSNILVLRQSDVRTILEQMMHKELPEAEFAFDEIAESAMQELMNQMMGASATVLSCFLGREINISTPVTVPIGGLEEFKEQYFSGKETLLTTKFDILIEGIMESEFISVMDTSLAKEIIDVSLNFDSGGGEAEDLAEPVVPEMPAAIPQMPTEPVVPQAAAIPPTPQAPPAQPQPAYQPYQPPVATQTQSYAPPQAPETPIVVKDFEYNDFTAPGAASAPPEHANLDLVMNVPVVVTVELGRTKRKIKEILEFGQGTIVELDRQAGAQVDVIVNGQLIAKGDVVVVDDNFSIRITEILKSRESLTML